MHSECQISKVLLENAKSQDFSKHDGNIHQAYREIVPHSEELCSEWPTSYLKMLKDLYAKHVFLILFI